jgi:hypothetical protein
MAICMNSEALKELTLAEVRRLLAKKGFEKLSAMVEAHMEPGRFLPSDFFCMVFSADNQSCYRCDEFLGQLQVRGVNVMHCVSLTLVGDEARLEYESPPHDPAICGKVVARCKLQ